MSTNDDIAWLRITRTQYLLRFGGWLLRLSARLASFQDAIEVGFKALDECRAPERPAGALAGARGPD